MKITPEQGHKLQSLGAVLREQALFQQVREDDEHALIAHFEKLGSTNPHEKGSVTDELVDMLLVAAIGARAHKCVSHLLPRVQLHVLHGSVLQRVIEKGQEEALAMIFEFAPPDEDTWLSSVERAVFNGRDQILGMLLDRGELPPDFLAPWREAVSVRARGTACLEKLLASNPPARHVQGVQAAAMEACASQNAAALVVLSPHVDLGQVLREVLAHWKDLAPGRLAAFDPLCEQFLPGDKLDCVADIVRAVKDAHLHLPKTHARLCQQDLELGTHPASRASTTPRL